MTILTLSSVSKHFGAIHALKDVSLSLRAGERFAELKSETRPGGPGRGAAAMTNTSTTGFPGETLSVHAA